MNYQQTSIRHSALGWVKKSIDDNLVEIKAEIKLYVEEDDQSLLVDDYPGAGSFGTQHACSAG